MRGARYLRIIWFVFVVINLILMLVVLDLLIWCNAELDDQTRKHKHRFHGVLKGVWDRLIK